MKNNSFEFNKYEYLFWFILAVIFVLLTSPFEVPIWRDRAYLLYMSQVVFRGEELYNTTTFGYTPLSPLIAGYTMQLIDFFFGKVDTITVSRVLGIILYGFITASFFSLVKKIYNNPLITRLVTFFFLGISFLHYLSSANFEPKMLALFFQLIGIYSLIKNKYLFCGIFLGLSAMCWQPMIINCFAVTVFIFTESFNVIKKNKLLFRLIVGVFIGTLPIVGYLSLTNQWQAFWVQAVIRKVGLEGADLFDKPFRWLFNGIYRNYINESVVFFMGGIGFLLIITLGFKGVLTNTFKEKTPYIRLLIIITLFWSLFNSMEFQGAPDLIPIIPFILIWAGFLFLFYSHKLNLLQKKWILIPVCISALIKTFSFSNNGTYSQQKDIIKSMVTVGTKVLPFSFEEYAVINEIVLPTKIMRFESYEDYVINLLYPNGCSDVIKLLQQQQNIDVIMTRVKINNQGNHGECGKMIIDSLTQASLSKSYFIPYGRDHFLFKNPRKKEFRVYQIIN